VPHLRASLAVLALLLAACGGGESAAAECDPIPGVRAGLCLTPPDQRVAAPAEAYPVLGDEDERRSLDEWRGQVLVLNFWASWCGPCRVEQPDLNAAHDALDGDDVAFLGVNIEDSPAANGLAHEREFEIPYPSLFDPSNDLAFGFGASGPRVPPSTLFLDRDGRVAARVLGTVGTAEVVGLAEAIAAEG
jgi:thiol-disulfide isomerase/thioredoxin